VPYQARLSSTFVRKSLADRKVCWAVSARFRFGRCRDFPASARSGNPIHRRRNGGLASDRQRRRQPAHEGRHAGSMPRTRTRTRSALPARRPASIEDAAVHRGPIDAQVQIRPRFNEGYKVGNRFQQFQPLHPLRRPQRKAGVDARNDRL
jgi:hypothetical protein